MSTGPWPRARTVIVRDLPVAVLVALLLEVGFKVALTDDLPDPDDVVLPLPDWEGRLLLLTGGLSLTFRRLAPVPVLAVAGTAALAYQALGFRPAPLPLAVLVALYTVSIVLRPLVAAVAAGTYAMAVIVSFATGLTPMDDDQVYVYLVSLAATAMLGYGIALSRARTTLVEQHATELFRAQDARTETAVAAEQARIAREVHDIVAHDVSVMVAQAAAARRVTGPVPTAAVDALASIESVGRDALDGLRRLMHLLRSEAGQPERTPQPSIERLPALLAQVERAGLPVELIIRGEPRLLPATVELNVFRIVQEALTNCLKHAGPTSATVVLDYRPETLAVEVRDHGHGHSHGGGHGDGEGEASSPGYGLIGMQQRASLLGGELDAAPNLEGGFCVVARLPLTGRVG